MKLFHTSSVTGLKYLYPKVPPAYKHIGAVVFASPSKEFSACFGGYWDDKQASILTYHSEDSDEPKYYNLTKVIFQLNDTLYMDEPCSLYEVDIRDFRALEYEDGLEYISNRKVRVLNEMKFDKWKDLLQYVNVHVDF